MEYRTIRWAEIDRLDVGWLQPGSAHARASSLVAAVDAGRIVGLASSYESSLHRSRLWLSVDVSPAYRRRGIGTALVHALSDEPFVTKPFAVKVVAASPAAAFAESLGGTTYQTCPPSILPTASRTHAPSPEVVSGASLAFTEVLVAFVDMYEWVHEAWSPISSRDRAFEVFDPDLHGSLDLELSSFILDETGIVAGAWVFQSLTPGGPLDGVAECRRRRVSDGSAALRAVVDAALARAAARGVPAIEFDCHASDPQMHPLVQEAAGVTGKEVRLVEIRA